MSEVKIEINKAVPIAPKKGRGRVSWKSLLKDMKVGDSFLWPDEIPTSNPLGHLNGLFPGWKFSQRKTDEGFRVWRKE